MAKVQNYRVVGVQWYGAYKVGAVLPEWVIARAGPVAEQVERGIVEPTNDPINQQIRAPENTKKVDDPVPAMTDDINRLREENGSLKRDVESLAQQRDALQVSLKGRDSRLGELSEQIEHLRAACEEHQTARDDLEEQVRTLTAELESATAPKSGKATKQQPATTKA